MASKKKHVTWLDTQRKAHEHAPAVRYPVKNSTHEYRHSVGVMVVEISSGDFFRSDRAASGRPQLATGPQKCVD